MSRPSVGVEVDELDVRCLRRQADEPGRVGDVAEPRAARASLPRSDRAAPGPGVRRRGCC